MALCTTERGLRTSVREKKWLVAASSANNSNCDGIWSQPCLWDMQDAYEKELTAMHASLLLRDKIWDISLCAQKKSLDTTGWIITLSQMLKKYINKHYRDYLMCFEGRNVVYKKNNNNKNVLISETWCSGLYTSSHVPIPLNPIFFSALWCPVNKRNKNPE